MGLLLDKEWSMPSQKREGELNHWKYGGNVHAVADDSSVSLRNGVHTEGYNWYHLCSSRARSTSCR